jgi:hypothetical protein
VNPEQGAILENVSKKARRGRPRCFSEASETMLTQIGIGIECHTRRGKQNHWWLMKALHVLRNDPRCAWLGCDKAAIMAGTSPRRR